MTDTIAVISHKGGTGKTTTVRTLADAFRRRGIRTLAVDLDPQGNLSEYFDAASRGGPTSTDVLRGRARAREAIRADLIPADLSLAETEHILGGKMGREGALRRALREVSHDYEIILIDCPPSLGLLTVNALAAATRALITAEAQYFAIQGVDQSIEVVELARETLNPRLSLLGVLLNLADMRTLHSREALASLKARYGSRVFATVVRASIAYAESAERAMSILDHRADLAVDYLALADEVLGRLPGRGERNGRILEIVTGDLRGSARSLASAESEPSDRKAAGNGGAPLRRIAGPGPRFVERYTELDRA